MPSPIYGKDMLFGLGQTLVLVIDHIHFFDTIDEIHRKGPIIFCNGGTTRMDRVSCIIAGPMTVDTQDDAFQWPACMHDPPGH